MKVIKAKRLTCCCCGETTRGGQWHNRDTGFGLCKSCFEYILKSKKQTSEEIYENYGIKGVHYCVEELE